MNAVTAAAARIEARLVPGPTRTAHALMLEVRPESKASALDVAREVGEALKSARSRAAVRVLAVTIVGALAPSVFAQEWQHLVRDDAALREAMSGIGVADVNQAAPSGQVLDRASLR